MNTDEENSMDFQPRHFKPSSVPDLPSTLTIRFNDLNGNSRDENPADPENSEIGGISSNDMNELCRSNSKES